MFKKFFFNIVLLYILCIQEGSAKMRIFTHVDTSQFPVELRLNLEHHPWEKGYLDVTKPPYISAKDGLMDVTAQLQLAIDHAYACNLVVFFPQGTYLVSDQLQCYLDPGPQLPNNPISSASQRKFGHILLGSEKEGKWPVIRLKDGSTVKDNTLFVFKYYDSLTGTEDASRHYLGSMRNFEIDMGENPGISAVYNNGAQLCALENLKIYGNFDMGISTLPGSGGYTANIEINGGRIGIYQNNFRPNPTLFNIRLENQSECGLMVLDTRGSLTVAGFSIVSPEAPSASYRAVYIKNNGSPIELGARANLNLVDGSIEMLSSTPAVYNYQQDLVVRNVFFKSAKLIESGAYSGSPSILQGDAAGWLHLPEYVFATAIDEGSVYRDRMDLRSPGQDYISVSGVHDSVPPPGLMTLHIWRELPSWEDTAMVDLVIDYGASPDLDTDDDAVPLQKAIDEITDPRHENYRKTLFIPRGHYHIRSTVTLKAGTKMIGAAKNISVILVSDTWKPDSPVTALTTENLEGPGIVLSDLAIVANNPNISAGLESQKYITAFDLRTGNSVVRDVQTCLRDIKWGDNKYREPIIRVSGNGGGKIYGFCFDEGTRGPAEEGYHLLHIRGARSPVTFYQASVEDASVELENERTVHMEIDSCEEVTIFGFKYEKESVLLHVNQTRSLTIIGGSGNYGLKDPEEEAIITIHETPNVFIGNISRKIQDGEIPGKPFLVDGDLSLPGDAPIVMYAKENDTTSVEPDPEPIKLNFEVYWIDWITPFPGAKIQVDTIALITDQVGMASTVRNPGTCFYKVEVTGYKIISDTLDLQSDTIIQVNMIQSTTARANSHTKFRVYPNPVADRMTVVFNRSVRAEMVLTDFSGRMVMSGRLESVMPDQELHLNLSYLYPGLYLLHIQSITGHSIMRIIKI
jgi:hypothetical protein